MRSTTIRAYIMVNRYVVPVQTSHQAPGDSGPSVYRRKVAIAAGGTSASPFEAPTVGELADDTTNPFIDPSLGDKPADDTLNPFLDAPAFVEHRRPDDVPNSVTDAIEESHDVADDFPNAISDRLGLNVDDVMSDASTKIISRLPEQSRGGSPELPVASGQPVSSIIELEGDETRESAGSEDVGGDSATVDVSEKMSVDDNIVDEGSANVANDVYMEQPVAGMEGADESAVSNDNASNLDDMQPSQPDAAHVVVSSEGNGDVAYDSSGASTKAKRRGRKASGPSSSHGIEQTGEPVPRMSTRRRVHASMKSYGFDL